MSRCASTAISVLLVACNKPAPAGLRVEPAAQQLLDEWAAAIGGRAKLAKVSDVHATGAWKDGEIAGTYESWASARGELRRDTVSDGVRYSTVFDGTRGWDVDASGLVHELDGPALDRLRTSALIASYGVLVPGRFAGEVTAVEGGVRVVADGSQSPVEIRFDPATHRPAQLLREDGGYALQTTVSDWRQVDGVWEAFASRTTGGETLTSDTVAAIDHAHGAFGAPADRDDDVVFTGPVDVPLEIRPHGELHVDVTVDGLGPVKMILDSGAPTVVDPARIPGAHFTTLGAATLSGQTGLHKSGYAKDLTIAIGGVAIGKHMVRTIDMGEVYKTVNSEIAGFVGAEMLSRVVVEIDYPAQRLRIYDARTYHHDGAGIPLTFTEGSPVVRAQLETADGTVDGTFMIDTGCECELFVVAAAVDQYRLLARLPGEIKSYPAVSVRRAPGIAIGDVHVDAPEVMLSQVAGKGILTHADQLGMIGGQLLRKYKVVFDYQHKRMWLDGP